MYILFGRQVHYWFSMIASHITQKKKNLQFIPFWKFTNSLILHFAYLGVAN